MSFDNTQSARSIMGGFKARLLATAPPLTVTSWTYADDFEDASVGDNPALRANWLATGAATDRYKVSTNKGVYNEAIYRQAGQLQYGPFMNDEFGFEFEIELNQSGVPANGDTNGFDGLRQTLYMFFQDQDNKGLTPQGVPWVDVVWDKPAVAANPSNVYDAYNYHNGILRRRLSSGEWSSSNLLNYPSDRHNIATLAGFTDPAKRTGRVAWESFTWTYDTLNAIRLRPLRLAITDQARYCSRSAIGSTTGRIKLVGDYKGTASSWAYRVINKPGVTVKQGWTTLTDVTASNGTFTAYCAIPVGGPYEIELAMTDSTGVTSSQFSKRVACGRFYIYDGQSNSTGRGSTGTSQTARSPKALSENSVVRSGTPLTEFAGLGTIEHGPGRTTMETARIVAEQTGEPCLVVATGIPGSGIDYIINTAFDSTFVATKNLVDGILDGVIWDQGEGDADGVYDPNYYFASLDTGYQKMVAASGNPNLPMWISPVGRFAQSGDRGASNNLYSQQDAYRRTVKLGYESMIAKYPGKVMYADSKLGTMHGDAYHYTSEGYDESCRRVGWSVAKFLGINTHDGRGPIPSGITRSGATITMAVNLNGATGLTDLITRSTMAGDAAGTPPLAGGLYGYQVSKDDFASLVPISSITRSGNTLVITLASDPGGPVKLRSFHGASYDDRQLFWGVMSTGENIPIFPITNYLTSN